MIDLVGNDFYRDHGYPHEAWTQLRREDPVHWYERPELIPFWAITKHEDVVRLSRQPKVMLNAPRLAVFPEIERPDAPEEPARHLLNMAPPEHGRVRKLVSARFTPRALEAMRADINQICREVLDDVATEGEWGEMDFVERVSARFPLAVLADLLGAPRSDWEQLFRWTNETIGSTDPEYQLEGETPEETGERARIAIFGYFNELAEKRRKEPTEDIISVLANSELDGAPLPPLELLSYYYLLVVAGNETTRNAASGGLLALIENPAELAKLRANPALIPMAVEEIVRWTTPVIQFTRTATRDMDLRGKKIREGESVCLFYPSANRDEEIFDDPFAFRVDRDPNPHIAFGIGEHFCLGANLARLELQVVFRQLVERLDAVELAGQPERLRSSFVGGIKHVPVRYRLR